MEKLSHNRTGSQIQEKKIAGLEIILRRMLETANALPLRLGGIAVIISLIGLVIIFTPVAIIIPLRQKMVERPISNQFD